MTDIKSDTKVYLTNIVNSNLTKDDDKTHVIYAVIYEDPDYPLTREFNHPKQPVDLLFLIGEPVSEPLVGHDKTPYYYKEQVPISPHCIDKPGITGSLLLSKAIAEIRRLTETIFIGSYLKLDEERPTTKKLGSTVLYSKKVTLNYWKPPA